MILELEAVGTRWNIQFESPKQQTIEAKIKKRVREFEKTYSRFRDTSFISKISNTTGKFILPEDSMPIFDLYFDLYKQTGGIFTPLIGQNLNEAGYDRNYSLTPHKLTGISGLYEAIDYDFPQINIKKPVQFDLGGIGKGYLIDIIGDLLKDYNIDSFTIDAGGDILHKGTRSITVGLEHPDDKSKAIGRIEINNASICASSGNRRRWREFHHIINPHKLESPEDITATWVVAEKAIIADSLATCLFLVPPESLRRYYKYEYLILYPDYSVKKSDGFGAEVFYA